MRDPDVAVRAASGGIALDRDGSYLVTGGLSGFGFAIARDLIEAGARPRRAGLALRCRRAATWPTKSRA